MANYKLFAKLCQEKKVRPADVSKATGINPATLTAWKQGVSKPKYESILKIADYFGVKAEEFYK